VGGGIRIYDRYGAVVRSLAELEVKVPAFRGIRDAIPYGSAAIVQNSTAIRMLGRVGLLNMLALEVEPFLVKPKEPAAPKSAERSPVPPEL
jgi:hypothetical protein